MDFNELVKLAESDLVKWLTAKVVNGFVTKIAIGNLAWLGWLATPLGWVVGMAIALFVKWGDWGVYMFADGLKNTAEGNAYEDAGIALKNLPPTATKEEINAAKKAKQDAFDVFMGAA